MPIGLERKIKKELESRNTECKYNIRFTSTGTAISTAHMKDIRVSKDIFFEEDKNCK
jgi:hypothetical protein